MKSSLMKYSISEFSDSTFLTNKIVFRHNHLSKLPNREIHIGTHNKSHFTVLLWALFFLQIQRLFFLLSQPINSPPPKRRYTKSYAQGKRQFDIINSKKQKQSKLEEYWNVEYVFCRNYHFCNAKNLIDVESLD